MATHGFSSGRVYIDTYPVQTVTWDAPLRWLRQGFADFKANPKPSLLYGVLFTAIGMGLLAIAAANPVFIIALLSGFLLVGPFIAVGLYDLSQQREEGKIPTLSHAFSALKVNAGSLALFALVLGMIMAFWIRSAAILTGLFFDDATLLTQGWSAFFANPQSMNFIVSFLLFGFALAMLVFSISVVAIPMINHHKVDVITAIVTSLRAVMRNPLPMILWSALIVSLIAVGYALFFVGLIVTLPLVGHASWHAYRDLVKN
jgi:uncharacterized membrane protein